MERLEGIKKETNDAGMLLSVSSDKVKKVCDIAIGQMQELHKRQKTANKFFVKFAENERGHIWLASNMIPEKDLHSVDVDMVALSKLVYEWSHECSTQYDAYETCENGFRIWYFEFRC